MRRLLPFWRVGEIYDQLTEGGINTYEYDDLGNLWKTNGQVTHTWDRANRLLSFGGVSYACNGQGQRVNQTVDSVTTSYVIDTATPLTMVLSETTGTETTFTLHGPTYPARRRRPCAPSPPSSGWSSPADCWQPRR